MISDNRQTGKRIFVSYSRGDKVCWRKLKTHLKPLEREGKISVWYDEYLKPGDEWEKRLEEKISTCDVFPALLSADFNASGPCREECEEALALVQKGEQFEIIPVLLRECDWKKAGLETFQMITDDGGPLIKKKDDLDRAGTLLCRKLDTRFPTSPKVLRPLPHQDPRPEVSLRDFVRAHWVFRRVLQTPLSDTLALPGTLGATVSRSI